MPIARRALLTFSVFASALAVPARGVAQAEGVVALRSRVAYRAICICVEEFVRGRIDPRGQIVVREKSRIDYIRCAVEGGILAVRTRKSLSHFTLLQQLVGVAEKHRSKISAEAFLRLATASYTRDFYSSAATQVRELGQFALVRAKDPTTWQHILSVAAGKAGREAIPRVRVASIELGNSADDEADEDWERSKEREAELSESARTMRRVAALRLLGFGGQPVFRSTLQKSLRAKDARLRLAAAEAMGQVRDIKNVDVLQRHIVQEKHSLVVMAGLAAIERTLRKHRKTVPVSRGMGVARALLPILGRKGWRNDMAMIAMLRRYPVKAAVPALITLLHTTQSKRVSLVSLVNRDASPVLADEIQLTLRQLTGALLPPKPKAWQDFWDREKDRIQLVAPYRALRRGTSNTKGSFFGITVVGREVVFILDTSGSMRERVERGTVVKNSGKVIQEPTRLDAAKAQTLSAVQGVSEQTSFHLVTFSSKVRVWNQKPVRGGTRAFRRLTAALERLEPNGGTNVYAALLHALGASQLRYGQQIKPGVDEIFLLSDGAPSAGVETEPERILKVVRDLNQYQKIRIHTVFTGVGNGSQFLRDLAAQNFGVYVQK